MSLKIPWSIWDKEYVENMVKMKKRMRIVWILIIVKMILIIRPDLYIIFSMPIPNYDTY